MKYITKPVDRDYFLEAVKKLLANKPIDNKEILVIDDDQNIRELLSRMLTDAGWEPKTAKDGKEGLELIESNPALIVLDLEMPRMDGFEFLNAYMDQVEAENRAPILVYTGKDLSDVQRELLEKNVAGLVKKDEVSMDQLSSLVKEIYQRASP